MSKKKANSIFLLSLSILPLFIMGGGLFFCCRNTGFSIDKITSRLGYNDDWEVDPLIDSERELLSQKVFPQRFYYLASGNQCYSFISEDREYILKFFKMKNLFPKDWMSSFPLSLLQKIGFKNETSNRLFSERIFASYRDAYDALREETALLYIHLNKTSELKTKVTLIDAKGKKSFLDLDSVEFIVQKRAKKIYDYLNTLAEDANDEELKICIRSFLQLIATRCEKGFVDHDLIIHNNFGFVGSRAVQFDCATLTRDGSMKYPLSFRNEVLRAAEHLDAWAQKNYPEASFFIQEEAQRIINQSF